MYIIQVIDYVLLNIVILCFLYLMVFWAYPKHNILIKINQHIGPLVRLLGLWHSWNMFSSPYHYNINLYVEVSYRNGHIAKFLLLSYDNYRYFLDGNIDSFISKILDNVYYSNTYNIKQIFSKYVAKKLFIDQSIVTKIDFYTQFVDIDTNATMHDKQLLYSYDIKTNIKN